MKHLASGLAVLATIGLTACGGAATTSAPEAVPSKTAAPPAAPSKPATACLPVDSAMGQGIMSGAEAGTGAKYVRSAAVKSPDFDKVYFIAVEFSADGVGKQVGVFSSNALTAGGGLVMAVDGMAQQFTVWPDADTTKAAISRDDPSVDVAKACLK